MFHEHVPKLQSGLDIPWPFWHYGEPFKKGSRVSAVCKGAKHRAVGIRCDNVAKKRHHIVKQVYGKKEVIWFSGRSEDIERVV